MPAPNQTPATAILIQTWGAYTYDSFESQAVAHRLWFKYRAKLNEVALGMWAHRGTFSPVTWTGANPNPQLVVWTGPETADVTQDDLTVVYNSASQGNVNVGIFTTDVPGCVGVEPGRLYYLSVDMVPTNVTISTSRPFTLSIVKAPDNTVAPIGSLLIPGAGAGGLFMSVVNPANGNLYGFVSFPVGEGGEILPDGRMIIHDTVTGQPKIYENDGLEFVTAVDLPVSLIGADPTMSSNRADAFYVVDTPTHTAYRINYDGEVDGGPWVLSVSTPGLRIAATPSRNDEILYYIRWTSASTFAVGQWDLVNDVGLSDLTGEISGRSAGINIMVLDDDTILVPHVDSTSGAQYNHPSFVRQFDPSGTLLQTFTLPVSAYGDLHQIKHTNDAGTFAVWFQQRTVHTFREYRVSDQAVLQSGQQTLFSGGWWPGSPALVGGDPLPNRFGIDNSCPIMISRAIVTIPPITTPPLPPPICPCVPPPRSRPKLPPTLPKNPPRREPTIGAQQICVGGGTVPTQPDVVPGEVWWAR